MCGLGVLSKVVFVRCVLLKVGLGVLLEVVLGGVWFGRASLVWRDCLVWRDWWDVGNG